MDQALVAEIEQTGAPRAAFYRFLASIFLYEPTQEQLESLAAADLADDGTEVGRGYALIAEYLRHRDAGTRQELAVDYAHVFLGAGSYQTITAPPYESVFTSEDHLLMQDARDGALRQYRAEELDLPADNTTPEDHVGFELQFMATLIERMGQAAEAGDAGRVSDLARKQQVFFNEHLANWLPSFAHAIDEHAKTGFYRGVACLVRGLLEIERPVVDDLVALTA